MGRVHLKQLGSTLWKGGAVGQGQVRHPWVHDGTGPDPTCGPGTGSLQMLQKPGFIWPMSEQLGLLDSVAVPCPTPLCLMPPLPAPLSPVPEEPP